MRKIKDIKITGMFKVYRCMYVCEKISKWNDWVLSYLSILQAVVVCFRLHFSKDNTTSNTASAIVQQVISIVFERVLAEDEANAGKTKGKHTGQLVKG